VISSSLTRVESFFLRVLDIEPGLVHIKGSGTVSVNFDEEYTGVEQEQNV